MMATARTPSGLQDPRLEARAARAELETVLDAAGWPWSRALSLWVDLLVLLQERGA
jgi:hypothetical protein